MALDDEFVIEKIGEAEKTEFEPQFTLTDLIGKTILGYRQIKNPKDYDPEGFGPNPEYFDVLSFTDGTFLLSENWGDGECAHLNFYYYDGDNTKYSDQLFGIT